MAKAENPLTEELAKFVQEKLGEWKVPGISVGVIDHDQVFTAVRLSLIEASRPVSLTFNFAKGIRHRNAPGYTSHT